MLSTPHWGLLELCPAGGFTFYEIGASTGTRPLEFIQKRGKIVFSPENGPMSRIFPSRGYDEALGNSLGKLAA